jgi:uncharacterized membrane protein YdjX (TVP38/TMEM64 family)
MQKKHLHKKIKFLIFLIILIGCWSLGKFSNINVESYQEILNQHPLILSGPIFIFLYVVITFFIFFGPKDIFRIMSAVLFGSYISAILISIAEIINAIILFTFSRKFGREYVQERFGLKDRHIEQANRGSSIWGILAIRINPLIPFRVMDLGFGLSSVKLKKYVIVSIVATFPRVLWLQFILTGVGTNILKDPQAVVAYLMDHFYIVVYSSLYFLGVLALTILAVVVKFMNKNNKR